MSTHGGTSTSAPPATTVTGPDTIGAPAVVGTGLHYARNDHDHGLPILDYNSMQYNDLLGWTFDGYLSSSNVAPTAVASIQLLRIPLPAQLTVTNVLMAVAIIGLTLTHSFLALFKSDGTVIGQTADQSTAWGTGGSNYAQFVLPLAGGPKVCTPLAANDFLWAGLYIGTAATLPTFPGLAATSSSQANLARSRLRCGTYAVADTATLPSIVPGSITNYPTAAIWFGLS
jgi:hypothetical protein